MPLMPYPDPKFPDLLGMERRIDDETLAKMEARATMASPGPWRASADRSDDVVIYSDSVDWLANVEIRDDRRVAEAQDMANAAFIAAARDDVPALVSEVRRLLAELKYVRDCIEGKDM